MCGGWGLHALEICSVVIIIVEVLTHSLLNLFEYLLGGLLCIWL